MDITDLKAKNEAVTGGYWVGDLPDLGDIRLHVLPARAPSVQRALGTALRSCKDRNEDGSITEEADARVQSEVYAKAALLGWENILDGGEPVEFTREKVAALMEVEIFEAALRVAVFKAGLLVDDAKERAAKN